MPRLCNYNQQTPNHAITQKPTQLSWLNNNPCFLVLSDTIASNESFLTETYDGISKQILSSKNFSVGQPQGIPKCLRKHHWLQRMGFITPGLIKMQKLHHLFEFHHRISFSQCWVALPNSFFHKERSSIVHIRWPPAATPKPKVFKDIFSGIGTRVLDILFNGTQVQVDDVATFQQRFYSFLIFISTFDFSQGMDEETACMFKRL
jgi:hypothetical protein